MPQVLFILHSQPFSVADTARKGKAKRMRAQKEVGKIAAQGFRLNENIRIPECRLISYNGDQLGIYPIEKARQIARDAGLDLVEIAPNSNPPVCRIMDYGKYKYEQDIKAKQRVRSRRGWTSRK